MRKNKFMRAASGLLVAVLLTTCVISGTFAKYTTSSTGTDSARVAKWGFETASVGLNDLFKTAYDQTVQSDTKVIAPGTKGEAKFSFTYGGANTDSDTTNVDAPEVKYTFKVEATGTCDNNIKNNKSIVWSLDGEACTDWDDLLAKINKLSGAESGTATYEAGKLPDAFKNNGENVHTVSWEWKYDGNDTEDTKMGNKADLDKVTLNIAVTAEQLD